MATATLTKTRTKVRTEDEPETKAEPVVVVTKGLATLVKQWGQAFDQTKAYFAKVCEYVRDAETSREELKKALMEYRGMASMTANNEVSKIFKAAAIEREGKEDLVQSMLDGDMTVEEVKKRVTDYEVSKDGKTVTEKTEAEKKAKRSDEPEDKLNKSLARVIRFAITELELESGELVHRIINR